MFVPFRRRKGAVSALGERLGDAVPTLQVISGAVHADALHDAAARTGADLGDFLEKIFDQLVDLADRATEEAGGLTRAAAIRKVQEAAARAADRAGDLAETVVAARTLSAAPRRRNRVPFIMFAVGGLALGTVVSYLVIPRRPRPSSAAISGQSPSDTAAATASQQGAIASLRRRLQNASAASRRAREEAERNLWREYNRSAYHIDSDAPPVHSVQQSVGVTPANTQ